MSETILNELLEKLWKQYTARVSYAQTYVDMVEKAGGRVVNDHIALRSFNTPSGKHLPGIAGLERVFLELDYEKKERYEFPSKHLTAYHYEHPNPLNPKIFISQLEVAKLSAPTQALINETLDDASDLLPNDFSNVDALVEFFSRPWGIPKRHVVEEVNKESQYAAWTLLHGHSVNHFTAFINEQQVPDCPDLPSTVGALIKLGVPMKDVIEGEEGSKLRQSSTQAVMELCNVAEDDGSIGSIEWSYAYYELAERGNITDEHGNEKQFTGFLGEQATNLFEMTKKD